MLRQINKKWIYRYGVQQKWGSSYSKKNIQDLEKDLDEQIKAPYEEASKLIDIRSKNTFSLMDLDQRFGILKQNDRVLELGCSPGGWSQYIVNKVKNEENMKKNTVLSVDIVDMPRVKGSYFIKGSVEDEHLQKEIQKYFDYEMIECVLCDVTPNYGEDDDFTHLNYLDINQKVVNLAKQVLKPGGTLLMKSYKGLLRDKKQKDWGFEYDRFKRVRPVEVDNWMEFYFLGQGFRMSMQYLQQHKMDDYFQKVSAKQQVRLLMDPDRMQKMFGISKEQLINIWNQRIEQSIIKQSYEEEFGDEFMDQLQNRLGHNFRKVKLDNDRFKQTVNSLTEDSSVAEIYELLKEVDYDGVFRKIYNDNYVPSFKELVENQDEMYDYFFKGKKRDSPISLLKDDEEYGRNYGDSDEEIFKQKQEQDLKEWEKYCRDMKLSKEETEDPDLYYQKLFGIDGLSKKGREEKEELDQLEHRYQMASQKVKLKKKAIKQKVYSKDQLIDEFQSYEEAVENDLTRNYDRMVKNLKMEDIDRVFQEARDDADALMSRYESGKRDSKEDFNKFDDLKEGMSSDKFKNKKF